MSKVGARLTKATEETAMHAQLEAASARIAEFEEIITIQHAEINRLTNDVSVLLARRGQSMAEHLHQLEAALAAERERDEARAQTKVLSAQVELLKEAHELANGSLRSALAIAERNGEKTNWPSFRETLRMSLEASHAAMASINATAVRARSAGKD